MTATTRETAAIKWGGFAGHRDGEAREETVPIIHRAGEHVAVVDIRGIRSRWNRNFYAVVHLPTGLRIPGPGEVEQMGMRTQREAISYADRMAATGWIDAAGVTKEGRAAIREPHALRKLWHGEDWARKVASA